MQNNKHNNRQGTPEANHTPGWVFLMSHQDARNWPQMGKENCVLQKAQEFKNNKRENTVKSGRLLWYRLQHHLAEVSGDTKNIWRPTRKGKAHHTRFLFKHVNGISINEGMHVMSETATIGAFQVKQQPWWKPIMCTGIRVHGIRFLTNFGAILATQEWSMPQMRQNGLMMAISLDV